MYQSGRGCPCAGTRLRTHASCSDPLQGEAARRPRRRPDGRWMRRLGAWGEAAGLEPAARAGGGQGTRHSGKPARSSAVKSRGISDVPERSGAAQGRVRGPGQRGRGASTVVTRGRSSCAVAGLLQHDFHQQHTGRANGRGSGCFTCGVRRAKGTGGGDSSRSGLWQVTIAVVSIVDAGVAKA
jgi:hypothetical protein